MRKWQRWSPHDKGKKPYTSNEPTQNLVVPRSSTVVPAASLKTGGGRRSFAEVLVGECQKDVVAPLSIDTDVHESFPKTTQMNPSMVQVATVEPRSDLGRWEDVEDECAEEHENVVTRNVTDFVIGDGLPNQSTNKENNVVPLANPTGAYERQLVVPTPQVDLNDVLTRVE
ncbi:hypothetical protein NE237_028226 [Protea cynaroides]|uniref:Uncharacterized protein n=1 Tax=Protea cynaroides TaxID=273540 RepID=A0A9Q0JSN4_9MAGN|nr:hypothetical protein NE237_028226 [Protea cynaroides]